MDDFSAAPVLTRITTRYVALEDRIRLAGEVEGAGMVSIWLTRRLLQRLLPKLLRGLEPAPANPAGEAPAPGGGQCAPRPLPDSRAMGERVWKECPNAGAGRQP